MVFGARNNNLSCNINTNSSNLNLKPVHLHLISLYRCNSSHNIPLNPIINIFMVTLLLSNLDSMPSNSTTALHLLVDINNRLVV
jgi:hypothetical protein